MRRTKSRGSWYAIRRDKLRALWSNVVRTRDGFICQKCGRTKAQGHQIDAAHILNVGSHPNLKYLVANGISLCARPCHVWYDAHKTSRHDGDADRWIQRKIGKDRYETLLILARTMRRPDKTLVEMELSAAAKETSKLQRWLYTCENCGEYDPETTYFRSGWEVPLCDTCEKSLEEKP